MPRALEGMSHFDPTPGLDRLNRMDGGYSRHCEYARDLELRLRTAQIHPQLRFGTEIVVTDQS